jgi:FkbM family methyltransferase
MMTLLKRAVRWIYLRIPLKKYFLSTLKRVYVPPPSAWQHLHFVGPFIVQVNGAGQPRTFRMNHFGGYTYLLENELFWKGIDGVTERDSLALWRRLAEGSAVIFDIGANTGIYSLLAATVSPGAHVHTFEPLDRVFEKLELNRDLNGLDIDYHRLARSDADGEVSFFDIDVENPYAASLQKEFLGDHELIREITVNTRTLASFIEAYDIQNIDLMKVDVEGHEPEVLEGMASYLERFRPTILIEVLSEICGSRIEQMLQPLGYRYFDLDERNPPRWVSHITKSSRYNYLACSEKTASSLGL